MEIRLRHPNPTQTTVQVVGDPTEPPAFGSRVIVPTSNYLYDPGTGLWIPQVAGPGGTSLEYNSYRIADLLSALLTAAEEGHDELLGVGAELRKLVAGAGLKDADAARLMISALGYRKVVGIDEGAYVAPTPPSATVQFTGVNLVGRVLLVWNTTERKLHWVTSVTDPVGATPGTLTLDPPVQAASASLRIPFASIPHGFDLLADGWRNNQLNPAQGHSQFDPGIAVTITGGQPDTPATQPTFAITAFNRVSIHVIWTCGSTATWQIDLLIRGYAGATAVNINSLFAVGGTALGAPAGSGNLFATSIHPIKGYELLVARTGVNGAVNANHTMNGTVNQHYA